MSGSDPEDFGAVAGHLAEDAMWSQPPPELVETILARIDAEESPSWGHAPGQRRPWLRPLFGVVAAAAVLVVGMVLVGVTRQGTADDATPVEVALAGTELAPTASASASLRETASGVAITLSVEGLPPAPEGFFYQAWVKGPGGLVAIGTFHMRDDAEDEPVELWSGVDTADYPDITVTLEPEDGDPASSGQRVLAGTLP